MLRYDTLFFDRSKESWQGINAADFFSFISSKCQTILTAAGLKELLFRDERLKVKFGIDPTASSIHLGHVVPIMLLRQFQKAGHQIDLVIGDFTARIGDPSGRSFARAPLTTSDIQKNMATYRAQLGKFIDVNSINVVFNSTWLNSMSLAEVVELFKTINLSEAIQRDDFRDRFANSQTVTLAEVCYGSLMGFDSVVLESDIEIGGIDQLLNLQQCRQIMKAKGMVEETILMTPILEGISGDGRKMSKSFGNVIAVDDSSEEKFGKIMSIPDNLITPYFTCFADISEGEASGLAKFVADNPLEAKKQLAVFIVSFDSGSIETGLTQRENFERKFSKNYILPQDCVPVKSGTGVSFLDVLWSSGVFASKSEIRRLLEQRAVRIIVDKGESVVALCDVVEKNCLLKVGKRRFFNIQVA